jgi:diguanylate cyclase (GGDEF)-like protein/PAS domain S-box-containing protein
MTMAVKPKTVSKPEKNQTLQDDLSHLSKAIIANAGVGIYIVQNGKFVYVSELYQKLSGYTNTELLGKYSLNNIYSDDREMVRDEAIKCLKRESFEPYEYRFIKKNNEVMWVLETITPIVYKDDRATLGSFMDITERKKAEEKLRYEEERFRAIANNSSDIIAILNQEGIITYENPAVERSLGLKTEERIGASIFDRIHPDDLNFARDAFNKFTLNPSSQSINFPVRQIRLRHQDGSWRTFETSGSKLLQNNIIQGVIINLRDITERKKAEEDLRESEEKYRLIFEYSPLGLLSFDEKGVIVACNDNFVKIIGSSREKLIGLNMLNLPDKNIVSAMQKALNGSPNFYEDDYSSVTARKITLVRCLFAPMNVGDGYIPGGVGIIEDITEHKKAESQRVAALDALRKSEDKYRTLIETTDTGYVIIDQDGLVRDANSEYVRLTGHHNFSEIVGRSIMEWTAESEKEKNAEAVTACFDKGYIRNLEIDYVDAKGNIIPIEINATCMEIEGKKHTITICRDISPRKHMEEKIRHKERRFRALVENSSDIIVVLDREGIVTYENPAFRKVLGFKPEERIGANGFELVHPDDLEHLANKVIILFTDTNDPVVQFEVRLRHKDGSWRKFEAVGSNLVNNNVVESIIINYRDITERKKMEDALLESEQRYRQLSMIDDLTQLYNSRYFYLQLEREIERSNRYKQPLTLVMLDLDNFKAFNDTYGHVEGDYVLLRLGQVIKRCLRETDSAYRYGGEEFTIVLPMTTNAEGMVTAQRIQMELKKEVFSPGLDQQIYVTVSIGLAQYKHREEMKAFVHRVDQLMYQAKKDGRDRICPES